MTAAIRPLPDAVAAQIKSSTTVYSLEIVVVELLKNALDASCHKIDVSVNFSRGACTVEDDGLGIRPGEFLDTGGLGKAYHTSKFELIGHVHGGEGTFLASLAAISILTITSHYHANRSSATLIYHHARPAARLVPAPSRYQLSNREHGTKVDVHDLFGNMPVRVKQRCSTYSQDKDHTREWDSLRRSIVGLLLAWHAPVNVVLRDSSSDRKMILRNNASSLIENMEDSPSSKPIDLVRMCGILSQAGYIEPGARETWIKTSARTPFITIRGAFSLQPVPSRKTQYIALGIRHLSAETGASVLYDEINRIFALSSFGSSEDPSHDDVAAGKKSKDRRHKQDGPTNKQLRATGKGVDRWPMFVIRIDLIGHVSGYFSGRDILEGESSLSSIVKALGAMATGFLSDNHFRPRTRRKRHSPTSASAIQSSATTLVPRPSSETRLAKQAKTGAFADDTFDDSILLPKVQVDRKHYIGETFSGWSRIKTGTARGVDDGFRVSAAKLKKSEHGESLLGNTSTNDQRSLNNQPSIPPLTGNDATPNSQFLQGNSLPSSSGQLTETIPRGPSLPNISTTDGGSANDGTLTWINPITHVPALLNARTGQMIPRLTHRSSASNAKKICGDGLADPVPRLRRADGLIRCTSTPAAAKSGSWVSNLLRDWHNPVFTPAAEPNISQVSFKGPTLEASSVLCGRHQGCSHREIDNAFTEASTAFSAKLSKTALREATVISQVDKKFILVLMSANASDEHGILALIDQHAADERVRVESLLADLHSPPSDETVGLLSPSRPKPAVATTVLPKALTFQITAQDHRLFDLNTLHLARWGILYELATPLQSTASYPKLDHHHHKLTVTHLPPTIAERCRLQPSLLIDLLRKEVWTREEDGPASGCPQGILDLLNSRACRSAIMFNDGLSQVECRVLVGRLAECTYPFQCAHGRPSMVPLVAVSGENDAGAGVGGVGGWVEDGEGFARAWRGWRGRGDAGWGEVFEG